MKTLVLALGNPILSDDAVGWLVADRLAGRLEGTDIIKESAATIDLIPRFAGYDRLVVIDAVKLGCAPPGTLYRFSLDDFASTIRHSSAHDINFATAFKLGRQLGYHIPADIRIYAIEVKELSRFAEGCSPEVTQKLDEITARIQSDLTSTAA
jgi:hydrogenase maturation protease